MMKGNLLILTIIVCCISHVYCRYKEWDYLKLVQEWPRTICMNHRKCKIPDETRFWVIHGLWPTKNGEKGPEYCKRQSFNLGPIKDLEARMRIHWPNLYRGGDVHFWRDEWSRHGTCALSLEALGSERKFFGTTLSLAAKYNLSGILSDSGIVPRKYQAYSTQKVHSALVKTLGAKPIMECYRLRDKIYLISIAICMTKSFKLEDCEETGRYPEKHFNATFNSHCGDHLYYPPIQNQLPSGGGV